MLRQICRALVEAHGSGMIHRDIKPDNIFICEQGSQHDVPKLLDFGLVHTVDDDEPSSVRLTQEGQIMGTPLYMSPEQVTGEEIDARSDLYSVGTLAYFLLTARPPFEGKNPQSVMYARIKRAVAPPSAHRENIPQDLEQVVLRCMAREPEERFSDARSLERALASCQCGDQWDEDRASQWWSTRAAASDGSGATQHTPFEQRSRETGGFVIGKGTLQVNPD
jgi:serine/threonine-protein kinase